MNKRKLEIIKQLRLLPGVGTSIARDLYDLKIYSQNDLINRDAIMLYEQLSEFKKVKVDKCMLYVFRCITYFSNHKIHDSQKLKWWFWKD